MRPGELAALVSSGLSIKEASEHLPGDIPELAKLAIALGGPISEVLIQLENQQRALERTEGELRQATAIPTATRRLLLWLPAVSLLLSIGVGLVEPANLLSPLVALSMAVGASLLWIGSLVSRRMLRSAGDQELDIRSLQLGRICFSSGMGLGEFERNYPEASAELRELIELSKQTGAALTNLIDGAIELKLAVDLASRLELAKTLQVRLLIPLGLTTLPAFLLFVLPPVVVGFANK